MANSIKLSNQRCKEILVQLSQHAKKIDCPFGHKKGRVPVSAQAKLGLLLKRPVSELAKQLAENELTIVSLSANRNNSSTVA